MTTHQEALLPCPFCGSDEPMLFCDPDEGRDNSGPSRRIQCAGCNIEAPFYPTEAEAIAAWNRRATPPVAEAVAAEQVDYPRILYVCEHCRENAPEMCGRSRDDLYVTPSGQWLCDECIDEEGVPISDCVPPPALYPASTVARLQQEIQRLTERELQRARHGACPSRPRPPEWGAQRMSDRASELRAIADGRLMLLVRNGVTVARSMLARIADEFEAMSTALAAKDAELAEAQQQYVDANEARIDAEAALAEARKALEEERTAKRSAWGEWERAQQAKERGQ